MTTQMEAANTPTKKRKRRDVVLYLRDDQPLPEGPHRVYKDARGYLKWRWRIDTEVYVEAYEHRIICGRPQGMDVHHINEIKDDNRRENLLICTPQEHWAIHDAILRARGERRNQFYPYKSRSAQEKALRAIARQDERLKTLHEMAELYDQGLGTIEIGRQFGVDHSNVSRGLRQVGVVMRPSNPKGAAARDAFRAVKPLIHARSNMKCELCGRGVAWESNDVHHRIPRGMGGSSDPKLNSLANLIHVCRGCHDSLEKGREEARANGWLISKLAVGVDPSKVPVLLFDGWHYLTDEGKRVPCPATEFDEPS